MMLPVQGLLNIIRIEVPRTNSYDFALSRYIREGEEYFYIEKFNKQMWRRNRIKLIRNFEVKLSNIKKCHDVKMRRLYNNTMNIPPGEEWIDYICPKCGRIQSTLLLSIS